MVRAKNSDISKLIFNASFIWLWGWFIFVVIEFIMRLIKGSPPWPFMILFTLLLYSGSAIAVGGVVGLLLTLVKKWHQRIEALPFIMSCSITVLTLLYTTTFIYDQFLPLYPALPRIPINLALTILSLIFLGAFYMILARIVDKTRLIASYLALCTALYSFMIVGLYINENLLSGRFLPPDVARIITNIGILTGCVLLYVLTCRIFIFIGMRASKIRKYILYTIIAILLIGIGGALLYIKMHSSSKEAMVTQSKPAVDRPNIILITMDTTRADHLSCYGYPKHTTPHLDKIASEGVMFKNAYAPSPWTLPSHASLFTSMYPARHGAHCDWEIMKSNQPRRLHTQHQTLAEILATHDYRTAGVIGAYFCSSFFGLAQGFEYYDDTLINVIPDLEHFTLFRISSRWVPYLNFASRHGLNGSRVASQINTRVFSWLENHYQSPFFLFINYYDPHHPYLPPDKDSFLFKEDEVPEIDEFEKRKRDKLARYDGEIAFVDYHMGKLFEKLRELNIYDPTMIIITSDHGEFFGEHDCWTHFYELYQEVITIPLIIKYPSSYSKKGVYINRVSLLDIMPTILNFLKIPLPENLQGVNLFEGRSRVMAEIYRHKYIWPQRREGFARELKALFLNNYKYIKEYQKESKGKKELYDIDNDPRELYNLIDAMPDKAREMEMKLTEWVSYDETRIPLDEPVKLDKKTEENLRVLGYIQ